ncbi:MAG TPA: CotH kinase family protein [Chryseolinea sp.]|nr:CotH kinase family protein [Chryseolinea sp.]HPH45928.1 CotH kinase family protein [Chryseolinea sp.]HPM29194.1 CotH kinase family protein [Chryseolinea sp.]
MKSLLTVSLISVIVSLANGQTFTSSNLPIVQISTGGAGIPEDPKITADMQVIYNGAGIRNNVSDPANHYDGKIGIEVRGSSSSTEKNQYSFQFRDNLGNQKRFAILDMPREEDWILVGPYDDKSLMREVLAYKLARDMNHYAPRSRFCELLVDGEYLGVYSLMENIKRDVNRVNVALLNPEDISGDNLTGGYLLRVGKVAEDNGQDFLSLIPPINRSDDQEIHFEFIYPKADVLVSQQRNYIENYVADFENALNGTNFQDPINGYRKFIDTNSFIDFLISQEMAKNVVGYRLSAFLHKQRDSDGGKLFMGPLWQLNLGFGNSNYCTSGTTSGFVYDDFNQVCPEEAFLVPFWWSKLMTDDSFRSRLGNRWYNLRNDKFQTSVIHEYIDSVATALDESQGRNFEKWDILGEYVWPNYYVGDTYEEEIVWLKNWVSERMIWLDENFPPFDPTAVNDDEFKIHFNSYPNPFTDEIVIEYLMDRPSTVNIDVIDMLGRNVANIKLDFNQKESRSIKFKETTLQPGVYFLRVAQHGNPIYARKMIKK